MPEELEPQEGMQESEELDPGTDQQSEAEADGVQVTSGTTTPKYVRYDKFREANEEKNRVKAEAEYLRQQLLQTTAMMAQQQAQLPKFYQAPPPTPIPPGVDPELAKIMDPLLTPLRQQNEYLARENAEIKADLMSQREWDRLLQQVPDIEELKDGIVEYLMTRNPNERAMLASSATTIVPIAEAVRARRMVEGRAAGREIQSDVKSRARTVKGAPATSPSNQSSADWQSMTSEEFFAHARKMGIDI